MRTTGVVKWYNRERGLGFITPDERGADVFLHHSAIEEDASWPLGEGDRVE